MFELNDDSVAVVIGSGAGGGTMSRQLAEKGIKVVCLEAGKRLTMGDIINDEAAMFAKLTWLDERIGEVDALADFPVWTCKTVGGTTMHWTAATPRLQEHEMKARTTYGVTSFGRLMDPLTDKVIVCAAFISFVELHVVPAWIAVASPAIAISSAKRRA